MEPFKTTTAIAAPIDLSNVNTDQIFPARFIKKPRAVGYAQFTFHDIRRDGEGGMRDDFPLNQPRFEKAGILVAGPNFGCGSSREGAVYTLLDSGIKVLIAPSFGDIFAANCLKNGVLTITLPPETIARIREALKTANLPEMTVDLEGQKLTLPNGETIAFETEAFQKHCLTNGLNEIDLSLEFASDIDAYEASRSGEVPWLSIGSQSGDAA